MRFVDTKGGEHNMDVRPSKFQRKEEGEGRGKFQTLVGSIIASIYPSDYILEEFPCVGERLHLDFFIPRKKIAVEVQGKQHHKFVEFFHGSADGFRAQRARDSRKSEWCELNEIRLVKIDVGEKRENIIKLILDE